jgi:hypothetical protein
MEGQVSQPGPDQDSAPAQGGQPADATPVRRRTTSITLHEIKAMKAVTTKAPPAHITAINKLRTMFTDLFGSFASIFSKKNVSQCDINGHVFPKGIWEGEFPRCSHCNKEIRSAEEMGTR